MNQLEQAILGKSAEVSGTALAPLSPGPAQADPKLNPARAIKTAQPYVDVSGHNAPPVNGTKTAELYAMPSCQRYPLDSYEQVKTASAYFDEWGTQMAPVQRREFCENLCKRASQLGIKVSSTAARYGGDGYATQPELREAMALRMSLLKEASQQDVLRELFDVREQVDPLLFASGLETFDKEAGLDAYYDKNLMDPYFSTFGFAKTAEARGFDVGSEHLSSAELHDFAKTKAASLRSLFSQDVVDEFRRDPEAVFSSLPLDQKKLAMRHIREQGTTNFRG